MTDGPGRRRRRSHALAAAGERVVLAAVGAALLAQAVAGRSLQSAGSGGRAGQASIEPHPGTVVVLLIDGLAPSLVETMPTPVLDAMRPEAAWTHAMEPAFPTLSMPNHVTLSTGCWPGRHGIVSNRFISPDRGVYDHHEDADWLVACEHIHEVAERQGVPSAALWWVGARSGTRGPLATRVSEPVGSGAAPGDDERVSRVLQLLRTPEADRPRLILAYLQGPDDAAHYQGMDARKTREAVRAADAAIGRILDELRALRGRGERATLIVTADHGMTEVRTIVNVKRILRRHDIDARFQSGGTTSYLYFSSREERDRAARELSRYRQFDVLLRDSLPESWHLGASERVGDIVLSARHPYFIEDLDTWPAWTRWLGDWGPKFLWARPVLKSMHGYPLDVPGMSALFYAWGDGIAAGPVSGLRAVDVHPTIAALLGIEPGRPLDGKIGRSILQTGTALSATEPQSELRDQCARSVDEGLALRGSPHTFRDRAFNVCGESRKHTAEGSSVPVFATVSAPLPSKAAVLMSTALAMRSTSEQ